MRVSCATAFLRIRIHSLPPTRLVLTFVSIGLCALHFANSSPEFVWVDASAECVFLAGRRVYENRTTGSRRGMGHWIRTGLGLRTDHIISKLDYDHVEPPANWSYYAELMKDNDEAMVRAWKEEVDTLLVFVGT